MSTLLVFKALKQNEVIGSESSQSQSPGALRVLGGEDEEELVSGREPGVGCVLKPSGKTRFSLRESLLPCGHGDPTAQRLGGASCRDVGVRP